MLVGAPSVYAMCAVDALGLPPMTGRHSRITSSDPANGKPAGGTFAAYFCPLANSHTDTASAQAFISGRDTTMVILDQDAAVELARYELGSLLG